MGDEQKNGTRRGELCDEELDSVTGGAIYMDMGDFPGESTKGPGRESLALLLPYIEQQNLKR